MKVAIYSRKSRMTGKGESIQNQIDMCKDHMEKYFEVEEFLIYEDEGFSGGHSDRPKYQQMLSDARSRKFSTLICYRLDRISRNISDFSDTIEILKTLQIDFISLREQFDTSTPMGRAMMYIASVFAQLERETIAERIKDNMLALSRTGRWLGGNPPTGYISEGLETYDDQLNKKTMYRLKKVPKEIAIVIQIFNKYLELGSLSQVESWALTKNIRTCQGNTFNITSMRAILTNMVYVKADKTILTYCKNLDMDIACDESHFDSVHGLMVYNKNIIKKGQANTLRPRSEWIVAVGKHVGIISSEKFIKVQKLILKNSKKAPKPTKNNISILSPLLKCKVCAGNLRTTYGNKRKDGTRLHYYKCILKEKSRGKLCNISNLNGRHTDKLLLDFLKDMTISYSKYIEILNNERKDIYSLLALGQNDHKSISKDIEKFENMIKGLTKNLSLTSDIKAGRHIIKQIEDLDSKIVAGQKKLDDILKENILSQEEKQYIKSLEDIIVDFKNNIYNLENAEKRYILNCILENIVWDDGSLKINFK